jgi:hypothetical protein
VFDIVEPVQQYGGVDMGHAGPSFGVQSTGLVSAMDAMGYAMTAQYWAGYWMGVAQAKTTSGPDGTMPAHEVAIEPADIVQAATTTTQVAASAPKVRRSRKEVLRASREAAARNTAMAPQADAVDPDESIAADEPSNVFITKKQFDRPIANGLKR